MSKSAAIVTGARQGIGRAAAIRLIRDFSKLVLLARNRANLDETAGGREGCRGKTARHRCRMPIHGLVGLARALRAGVADRVQHIIHFGDGRFG